MVVWHVPLVYISIEQTRLPCCNIQRWDFLVYKVKVLWYFPFACCYMTGVLFWYECGVLSAVSDAALAYEHRVDIPTRPGFISSNLGGWNAPRQIWCPGIVPVVLLTQSCVLSLLYILCLWLTCGVTELWPTDPPNILKKSDTFSFRTSKKRKIICNCLCMFFFKTVFPFSVFKHTNEKC